ncbi:hypothetical protein AAG747_16920 [Rapidithrix thailandica]|uniref:Glycosyltransferase RgtA/B/C/D-like domain-containing protein n=1 Tax=Rapidithrix thailandica TaxID=413964 RepID=A0AAW9S9G0_9BACT
MELKDVLLSPLYLVIVYVFAFYWRGKLTDERNRKFFIPALSAKIFGAFFFACIYEFYYGGGDTFTFHYGSKLIWQAFLDTPSTGIKMLFLDANEYTDDTVKYLIRLRFFRASEEWSLVKIAGFVGLFTFNSYLSISIIFATFSFFGTWKLYQTFLRIYPSLSSPLAFVILFVPSAIFWASGLMKDTITLGCIGFLTYGLFNLFYFKRKFLFSIIVVLLSAKYLIALKMYILLSFAPAFLLWIYTSIQKKISNVALQAMMLPVLLGGIGAMGYLTISKLASSSAEYASMDAITYKVAAFHHDHLERAGGSSYSLGDIEYTPMGMLKKFPSSVNVTLFRPYLWEARNVVVLFGAVESLLYLLGTLWVFFKVGPLFFFKKSFSHPDVLLCLVFTLLLGFIVGLTSYNFGALGRFKVPLMPYYGITLVLIYHLKQKLKHSTE